MYTVLIVDDDPAIRDIFSIFLEKGGYNVRAATGGTECLKLLQTGPVDLILLDIMMEPMDGWETLLAIRSQQKTRDVPVIMVTGKPPIPEEIMEYGAWIEDYIMKPADFPALSASIMGIIGSHDERKKTVELLKAQGSDKDVVDEYIALLHEVGLYKKLGRLWQPGITDEAFIKAQDARLQRLQQELGLPPSRMDRATNIG